MSLLQHLMERLRPIVGSKSWDYCVLWKLSEDQRLFEWVDCCCAGTENIQNGGEELLFHVSSALPCKDGMLQHPRTKSCDLLDQLSSSIPLDSGTIHAQTLLSNQPKWLNFRNISHSDVPEEIIGTRVLIPVPFGLIELFVDKQVTEDQSMINFVTSQFNFSPDQQPMINSSCKEDSSFSVRDQQKEANELLRTPFSPATMIGNLNLQEDISPMNFLEEFNFTTENGTRNNIFLVEGYGDHVETRSPTDSDISRCNNQIRNNLSESFRVESGYGDNIEMHATTEKATMMSNSNAGRHVIEPILRNKKRHGNDNRSDSVSDCSEPNEDEDDLKYRKRGGKGPQSKNLVAERKRRKKLNDRLYALRALVPNISKLDRAAILGDAIEYVMELQKQVQDLQNELQDHNSDDDDDGGGGNNNTHSTTMMVQTEVQDFRNNSGPKGGIGMSKQNHDSEMTNECKMETRVEVAQLDGNEFFVKVFCEHKPGGFVKLMEALNSLGFEVTSVNVSSYLTLVLNVFQVEKRDSEMVKADHVRESLLELTRNPSKVLWPEMDNTSSDNGNVIGSTDHHHHHQDPHFPYQLKSQSYYHHLHN